MKIGIYINPTKLRFKGQIAVLLSKLKELKVDFYLNDESEKILNSKYKYETRSDLVKNKALVIVIGGDGTFLRLLQETEQYDTKYVLANIGYIGFLSSFSVTELIDNLEEILSNKDKFIDIPLLQIRYERRRYIAINDIILENKGVTKLLKFKAYIDGKLYHKLRASGIIISSPTGSTALNYSSGGPIVEIGMKLLIYKPVCSQFNASPPVIFNGEHKITIENRNKFPLAMTLDGNRTIEFAPEKEIDITICKNKKFKLVLYKSKNIDDILREKFFGDGG